MNKQQDGCRSQSTPVCALVHLNTASRRAHHSALRAHAQSLIFICCLFDTCAGFSPAASNHNLAFVRYSSKQPRIHSPMHISRGCVSLSHVQRKQLTLLPEKVDQWRRLTSSKRNITDEETKNFSSSLFWIVAHVRNTWNLPAEY
jgi:hypothetical protein